MLPTDANEVRCGQGGPSLQRRLLSIAWTIVSLAYSTRNGHSVAPPKLLGEWIVRTLPVTHRISNRSYRAVGGVVLPAHFVSRNSGGEPYLHGVQRWLRCSATSGSHLLGARSVGRAHIAPGKSFTVPFTTVCSDRYLLLHVAWDNSRLAGWPRSVPRRGSGGSCPGPAAGGRTPTSNSPNWHQMSLPTTEKLYPSGRTELLHQMHRRRHTRTLEARNI